MDPMECDYCGKEIQGYGYLRAVGLIEEDGQELPEVKVSCEECQPTDNIDERATEILLIKLGKGEVPHGDV